MRGPGNPGGPPGGRPDPIPLDPIDAVLPDGGRWSVERTFDVDGVTTQIIDQKGNVLREERKPAVRGD